MAAVSLTPVDLEPFAEIPQTKAEAMIDDAMALAARVAPCMLESTFSPQDAAAAKAILRSVVLRWNDAGAGAVTQAQVDDASFTFGQPQRRGLFWPSEIQQLQALCKSSDAGGAFSVDTVSAEVTVHADICALRFGAQYCSCGAVLTQNLPLYESYG